MSKGANSLIGKATQVAKGLETTVKELEQYGVSQEDLAKFKENIEKLIDSDAIVEEELAVLAAKRRVNTGYMEAVYDELQRIKRIIKANYDKDTWSHFGVSDKQ